MQYARVTGGKNSAFCETGQQKEVYFGIVWTKFDNLGHFGKLRVHSIIYIFFGPRNEQEFEFYDQMQNSRIFSQNSKLITESNYTLKML